MFLGILLRVSEFQFFVPLEFFFCTYFTQNVAAALRSRASLCIRAWDLFKLGHRLHNEKWILLTLYDSYSYSARYPAVPLNF